MRCRPHRAVTQVGARQGDRLYVVNAQFTAGAGAKLPFWVSNIELP